MFVYGLRIYVGCGLVLTIVGLVVLYWLVWVSSGVLCIDCSPGI